MKVSEIIELLPASLDWMVLFNLEALRPLFDDLTIKRMFLLPEAACLEPFSHAILTEEGTILAPQSPAPGSSLPLAGLPDPGRLAWGRDGRLCPLLEQRPSLRQRFEALARLMPLDEADCLGLGEIPAVFPPVLLHLKIQGGAGQAKAVFSQQPSQEHYELLRAVGVRYLDGEWQAGQFIASFQVDLRQHIFPGLLSNFSKTGYCNAFFLQQGSIGPTLEAGLSGAVHDRVQSARLKVLDTACRLARQILAPPGGSAPPDPSAPRMLCQPPLGAPPFEFGDLPPAALLARALKSAALPEAAALGRRLEDWLLIRRLPLAALDPAAGPAVLWPFQSGDLPTAADSALVLMGVSDLESIQALENFADGQGGYLPQLADRWPAGEGTPGGAGRMRLERWNAHWQQADFATTCLVRFLRRQAGLPQHTPLERLEESFERRAGLFLANPYWVDWALALALAGDPAPVAEGLRGRLAAEILSSVNPDHTFGAFDRLLSTALAVFSLEALGYLGRTLLMAQLRLSEMVAEEDPGPACTPFYSALRMPETLAAFYRPADPVEARRRHAPTRDGLLGDAPDQVVCAGDRVFLLTWYVDQPRLISTAAACLALADFPPDPAPAGACPHASAGQRFDPGAAPPHPRYRCASQAEYIARFALQPYLLHALDPWLAPEPAN